MAGIPLFCYLFAYCSDEWIVVCTGSDASAPRQEMSDYSRLRKWAQILQSTEDNSVRFYNQNIEGFLKKRNHLCELMHVDDGSPISWVDAQHET